MATLDHRGYSMRQLFFLFIFTSTLLLAGCGSKQYEVTTKGGDIYTAKGALKYDVQSETYSFENEQGLEVRLNQEDIEVIQEKK